MALHWSHMPSLTAGISPPAPFPAHAGIPAACHRRLWTQLLWPFPKNVCLDPAHDNIPTYQLLEHWDINALIDINGRAKASEDAPDDITFNKDSHPLCKAGHEICP